MSTLRRFFKGMIGLSWMMAAINIIFDVIINHEIGLRIVAIDTPTFWEVILGFIFLILYLFWPEKGKEKK